MNKESTAETLHPACSDLALEGIQIRKRITRETSVAQR
jgi:hypothetical protein